jgi:hypothetical protein
MAYFVTCGTGAVSLDQGLSLEEAFFYARLLAWQERTDIAICDISGKYIRGDKLAACCRGEKRLTANLQAVSN